jgi:competence protein ComEC
LTTENDDSPNPALWARTASRLEPLGFRRAPLLGAAVWFALGEVMARNWQPAIVLLIALVLLVALTIFALRSHT